MAEGYNDDYAYGSSSVNYTYIANESLVTVDFIYRTQTQAPGQTSSISWDYILAKEKCPLSHFGDLAYAFAKNNHWTGLLA